MKRATFSDIAKEINHLLEKAQELEAPRADLRRQVEALADKRANLLVKIKAIDKEVEDLQAKARKKMLELTALHAVTQPGGTESQFERDNRLT